MTMPDDERRRIEESLAEVAGQVGATVDAYPRPGTPVRRVVLRDVRNDRGTQYEEAVLEDDGTVRVTGVDRGPGVSDFFGEDITSYDWVLVVPPARVPDLITALGGSPGVDVLPLLATYYEQVKGRISGLLRGPRVRAEFHNWHS
jgi:hypothetical protein